MVEPLSAGSRLHHNRYTITRVIAAGGMGVVYLAFDEVEEINVAVKQTFFTDPELRKAFEREAKLLERLDHPRIPKVTDRFEVNGQSFLVMTFVTGKDLSQLLAEKLAADGSPFPVEKVIDWADSLLATLEYLHGLPTPVIHRDIKPANLKESRDGKLMLLDFGLAKGYATQQSQMASVAAHTPGFAAIEQMQGAGTDARSDLYSVGATMYQLLTGAAPPSAMVRSLNLIGGQTDPLPPIINIAPSLLENVSKVIESALSVQAASRPQSAREMRELLVPPSPVVKIPPQQAVPILPPPLPVSQSTPTSPSISKVDARPEMERKDRKSVSKPPLVVVGLGVVLFVLLGGGLAMWYAVSNPEKTEKTLPKGNQEPQSEPKSPLARDAGSSMPNGNIPGFRSGVENPATDTGPQILFVPKPKYTEEGRLRKISGKVVLSVEVYADGKVGKVSVVSSLGYGLDENAIASIRQARFIPATKDGTPVTSTARVEVNFSKK